MSRINLLPPEIIAGRKARREGALLAIVFGAVVLVLAGLWLMLHLQLNQQEERLSAAQAKAQDLQTKINTLQPFAALEQSIISRVDLLSGAMTNDIGWSRVLREVSKTIPSHTWLVSLSGTADEPAGGSVPPAAATPPASAQGAGAPAAGTPPAAQGTAAPPATPAAIGSLPPRLGMITFVAKTSVDFPGVAQWISDFERVVALQNLWVPRGARAASEPGPVPGQALVDFESTVDLSPAARSGRYQRQP